MNKLIITLALVLTSLAANCQTVSHGVTLPDADELHISQGETNIPTTAANKYMRVTLDYTIKAGEWTILVLPCKLDGYYFSPEAERYLVTDYDTTISPTTITYQAMDDSDDFQPNRMYLVKSKIDIEEIVCLTPGLATEVSKQQDISLMCITIDDFKAVDGIKEVKADNSLTPKQIYDLAGRAVKSAKHGVFIVNGRKVYVK